MLSRPSSLSSIPWLVGQALPIDWRRSKVKYLAPYMQAGETITAESIDKAGAFPVYGGNGLRGFTESSTHSGVSILIGRQGALCGNVHLVAGEFWASEHAIVARAATNVDIRWLSYLLRVMDLGQYSQTVAQPGIGTAQIGALEAPVPPLEEQREIADFLDRETARIDTLIEEQQRLIDLLIERRADLIRHTVLGQMNPLNPTPADATTAVGHHFSVTLGKMLDAGKARREEDQILPYIRAGNIQDAGLRLDDVNSMPFSAKEAADLDLRRGDLLVAEGGAVGTNALLSKDMPGWSFQKTVNRVRSLDDWSTAWLGYVLRTYRDLGVIDIICNKSTIAHLTAEKLRSIRLPLCDIPEQQRIVAFLDEATLKIDTLIGETEVFIELARERRSALITAAVTGQIVVRDEVW